MITTSRLIWRQTLGKLQNYKITITVRIFGKIDKNLNIYIILFNYIYIIK